MKIKEAVIQLKQSPCMDVVRGPGDLYPLTAMLKQVMTQSIPTALQVPAIMSLIKYIPLSLVDLIKIKVKVCSLQYLVSFLM